MGGAMGVEGVAVGGVVARGRVGRYSLRQIGECNTYLGAAFLI